jgi:molybdopterin molybdotransferase
LQSRQLMLAAAMNHATVPVRRKPIVAVLANGDELVQPGQSPAADQIISSIPAGMQAAITAWGGAPVLLDLAQDSKKSLAACVRDAQKADVLLTIGGASVGEHDLVRGTLEDMGARFEVLRVAMRPGKPAMFGFLGNQRILGLPGNPASAIICARVFLKPLVDRFLGRSRRDELRTVRLAVSVEVNGEREHYMRALLSEDGVAPIGDQDSSCDPLKVQPFPQGRLCLLSLSIFDRGAAEAFYPCGTQRERLLVFPVCTSEIRHFIWGCHADAKAKATASFHQ